MGVFTQRHGVILSEIGSSGDEDNLEDFAGIKRPILDKLMERRLLLIVLVTSTTTGSATTATALRGGGGGGGTSAADVWRG
jgi:hypothetical protein